MNIQNRMNTPQDMILRSTAKYYRHLQTQKQLVKDKAD